MLFAAILGVGTVLACLLTWINWNNRKMERTLISVLNSQNREWLTAIDLLTIDINRLKEQVKKLEDA